jgi:hypothetical protein
MRRDGAIFNYDFVWKREAERGEETGRKTRPVCLQLMTNLQDRFPDPVLLVPCAPSAGVSARDRPNAHGGEDAGPFAVNHTTASP